MKKIVLLGIAFLFILLAVACGPKIMVPPRIDLKPYEVIGIIDFNCNMPGVLPEMATRRFTEFARRDQGMVRIVNLGSESALLKSIGATELNRRAFIALGEKYEINTIIAGDLVVSDIKPEIHLSPGLGWVNISAVVDAILNVEMVETATGASIWSGSGMDKKKVGEVSVFGRKDFAFNAQDPDKAYGILINSLVHQLTQDFRVRWVRQSRQSGY